MNTESWKCASPEQINLWKHLSALFNPTGVQTSYYQGVIAGSPFVAYDPDILYLCLELMCDVANTGAVIAGAIQLHNELNNVSQIIDASGKAVKNVYFSRISNIGAAYTYINFNGFILSR